MKSLFKRPVLVYLKLAAKIQLLKFRPRIIGVGGASGKSSTAGFIYSILKANHSVRSTEEKNSETGLPLSILGIKVKDYSLFDWLRIVLLVPVKVLFDFKKYDYLVAEMGIDGPDYPLNMDYLLSVLKPSTALVTNVTYEHSLNFEHKVKDGEDFEKSVLNLIAKEELKLLTSLPEKGMTILNLDDSFISDSAANIQAKQITVSAKKEAGFRILSAENTKDSFSLKFTHKEKDYQLKINQPLPFYFSYSFVLAIAACYVEGLEIEDCIETIQKSFSLPAGRASVFEGVKNTTIIDSSYNNSLDAAVGMLEFLKDLGKGKRKVAIIGDMREQGKMSEKLHQKLAQSIMDNSDFAVLVGPLSEQFIAPVLERNKFQFVYFRNVTEAKEKLLNLVKNEDVILVKASQNALFLERLVEMLLKDKSDVKKLPRRGEFWNKIRANIL